MPPLWLLILWFIYFIFPFDLFPDVLPGVGWLEDFLIVAAIYWMYRKKQQAYSADETGRFKYQQKQSQTNAGSQYHGDDQHRSRTGFKDPYKILGIEQTATPIEIKRAYRTQANRYHPDKVAHLGEEFQTLAKEKFQDIQWAYEQLLEKGKAA